MTIVIVGTLFLNFGLYSIYEYYVAMYGVCVWSNVERLYQVVGNLCVAVNNYLPQ